MAGLEALAAGGLGARRPKAAAVGLGVREFEAAAAGLGARELKAAVGLRARRLKVAAVGLGARKLKAAAVGVGVGKLMAAALLELGMGGLAAMGQAAALLEPRARKLVATALVCGSSTRARGLTAAALLELRAMGQAAAREVAAGPLLLTFELLRGLDSVCPVSEFAPLKQLSLRECVR